MEHVILHIPHASVHIPNMYGYTVSEQLLKMEINLLTDWYIDEIFDIPGIETIKAEFSRIFCDVERFIDDDIETMSRKGMGFAYTHGVNGDSIREITQDFKDTLAKDYYNEHHRKLTEAVDKKLDQYGKVLIIDCHSFPDIPLPCDIDQERPRPDICVGTDKFHTPSGMGESIVSRFNRFDIRLNSPYSGTIVPMKHYMKDPRVSSVMIEINRSMYMKESAENPHKLKDFYKVKGLAMEIINYLRTIY